MSQSRELQQHIGQLEEIGSILKSIKNLAFMEAHKLSRNQPTQLKVVRSIEEVARDFLTFNPSLQETQENADPVIIAIGSERGFCGDFNASLIKELQSKHYTSMIAVGSRLGNRLKGNSESIALLSGANTAEEVPDVLNRVIDCLSALQCQHETMNLTVLYHQSQQLPVSSRQILPPFQNIIPGKPESVIPPLLNLAPAQFLAEIIDQYLFAALHEIFYHSLMVENYRRLQHLEGAVKHLEDETVKLRHKTQIYRQEEITEEIEVILLNAENL